MNKETFCYRVEEHVATITFSGSKGEEIACLQKLSGFEDVIKKIISDSSVRVVIISGKETFSSGTSFEIVSSLYGGTESVTRLSLSSIIYGIDLPTIAAIKGNAFGQGLELALGCDIRVASDTSHFGLPHINAGMIPWDGGTQRLSRLVGKSKAIELILTGESINAHEAHRIGLVNQIVHAKDLMATVTDMAQEMASRGPIALRYAKEAIHKGMDLTLEQGLRLEADLYFLLHTTRDRTTGIRAFQEKRKPRFEGT